MWPSESLSEPKQRRFVDGVTFLGLMAFVEFAAGWTKKFVVLSKDCFCPTITDS
jgi:hypothetical protein